MVWPTQDTTRDEALKQVDLTARRLKANSAVFRGEAAAGNINADRITEEVLRNLVVARNTFTAAAAVPGMAAFVAAERSVTQQQVADDFNAMLGAVNAAISWIAANMPKNGAGFLLIRSIDAQGALTYRQFTPAETAGLRTALLAVEATIG